MNRIVALISFIAAITAAEPGLVRNLDQSGEPMPRAQFDDGDASSSLYIATSPSGSGKAVRFEWAAAHGANMRAVWEDRTAIGGLTGSPCGGSATMKVRCADPQYLGRIFIQLMDSNGQTMQWARPAQELKPGAWTTVTFDFKKEAPEVWGGDGSGRLTPPYSLWAVIVDMSRDAPAGELWIDDIAVTP